MRKLFIGLVAACAVFAALFVGGGAATSAGDPLNGTGHISKTADGTSHAATQGLKSLDGHIRLVYTGTNCRDSKYGSGEIAVRTCNTQDDLGALGGNWVTTDFTAWNPGAPIGKVGDVLSSAKKYNVQQTCSGAGGTCTNFDDGETAWWFVDELKPYTDTVWGQWEGHSGSTTYCRRVFTAEDGSDSEVVYSAATCP